MQVTGIVAEYQGQTEIDSPSIDSCGASATPTPTDVTLPVPPDQNGVPYLERFEGMLVRFHQTLYVTEHYQLGRFGQIVMSSGGRLPQPTSIVLPGAAAVAQQTANSLNAIIVDDGDNKDRDANDMDPILFGRGGNPLSASNTLRGGDTAADIVGVMTYGWAGNSSSGNAFRLRPINALGGGVPHFAVGNARPNGPPNVNGSLKVVGMNVLNYFLTLDIPANVCGPTGNVQECRGANTDQEKTRQQGKLNAALVKLDADIIGMSELENTTGVDTLGDIVGRLNTTLGSAVYSYITYGSYISDDGLGHVVPITGNSGGTIGTDDIRVGLVYKTAKVAPIGVPLVNTATIHNRPPVAQLFSETATGERFTVVVNHYRSKGCSSNGLTGDADSGDGQGCFNATRVAQSQALLQFIQHTVLPTVHDPDILLVGDFNAYAKEDPIRAIEAAGFTNLISRYSGPNAYSYLFSGQWGYIDQALASTSLVSQIRGAGDYHINADEPSDLDYNTEYKSPALVNSLYNVDEFRISDHDPVVIGVSLRPSPQAVPDHFVAQSGSPLNVSGAFGVLSNDTGGPLSIFSHTSPAHGTLTLNADGSFVYTPAPSFFGTDSFNYTINNTTPAYLTQLLSTNVAPLGVFGGVTLTGGGYGSSLYPVPGSPNEFYGLTDRGPNVDDPTVTFKVEPIPSFAPAIGKFRFDGDQAVLEQVIPLRGTDGTLYNGLVNSDANTGETIDDLNGVQQPASPYGYDSEGLVALPDGTFWVSDEYGPFITHFDQNGVQIGRLSPFDGTLPYELSKRLANRGMEGLTITPDGTMLVGMMQSALVQGDLSPGFNVKKITPVRIVTYRLSDGAVHEYIYLLDDPGALGTAVSEITALSNTTFLVDERDGNFPPNAYKRLYKIDITGATDVGPLSSGVPNSGYNGLGGGLLINGKTIEFLLKGFQTTAGAAPVLTGAGITPVTKTLALDVVGLLTAIDPQARVFGHDKIEGVAALNGGATLVLSNDSDFGISGSTGTVPPGYQLVAKITPSTGLQDDGEFLVIDLVRSDGTVTIEVDDTIPPQTELLSTPTNPSNSAASAFTFAGTDSGSGVSSFECSIDGMSDADFAACASGVTYTLAGGNHTFAVRAVDAAGNKDPNAVTYPWTIDTVAPDTVLDTTPSAVTALTTAAFNFHGTDAGVGVSSFQCQIDTGAFAPCSSGVSYAGLAQGGHTFSVYAIDGAGNRDPEPATFAWIVDTTAPETAFDSTPGNPTNSRTATFTFHGADASTTTFECSVDGATFASCASGGSYSGLADGAHTFQVRAVDAAGNVDATPALFTWTVDATAPETVIDVTPANPTSATTASFTFHAMDAGTTTFECSLDSGAFAACASGVSYTGVADGGHSFNVRATDNVGNVDATPAQFAWAVDTTAPNTLIDTTPSALTNTAAAAFSFHSTDAGGSTFQCSLDSAAFANCASGIAYAGLADGVHTFAVKASDALGNTDATPAKYSWTVDTTPPVIAPHADVSATATSPSGAVVTYTPPAAHDVIGGDGVATCAPASGSPFAVGQTQVTCTASDAAGNAAAPTHFTVTVSPFVSAVAHFVAFSKDFTWLRANSTAITGDVGANQRRRPGDTVADDDGDGDDVTVRVGEGAAVQQRGSRVVGDTVQLLNKSSVHNIVDNFLLNKKGTILGSVSTTMTVPFTTLPAFPSITPGAQNMTVARNKTVTLAAGNYGAVHVNAGGTLVLTGGVYQMLSLDLDQSATVLFHAATQLLIKTELDSGSKATLIPDPAVAGLRASQMVIYVEGRDENCRYLDADDDGDDAGPTTVNIGPQSVVQANIYAANGTVWLKSKTQATGAFVGVHVRIGVNAQLTLDSAF